MDENLWGVPKPPPLDRTGLSLIEFVFAMELSWDDRHQSHSSLLW